MLSAWYSPITDTVAKVAAAVTPGPAATAPATEPGAGMQPIDPYPDQTSLPEPKPVWPYYAAAGAGALFLLAYLRRR